jgi:hypothetical protein
MPRGDRTGPAGMGPMTGRAAGYCAGNTAPGFVSVARGRGFGGAGYGGGRGRRRGRRNWFHATGVPGWQRAAWGWPAFGATPPAPFTPPTIGQDQELDALKRQAETLSSTLDGIRDRIAELEGQAKQAAAAGSDA